MHLSYKLLQEILLWNMDSLALPNHVFINLSQAIFSRCSENTEKYWHYLSNRNSFSSQTSKFLIKYNLLRFQISGRLVIYFSEHDY